MSGCSGSRHAPASRSLPDVVDRDRRRWGGADAGLLVKRRLGLSSRWTGAHHGSARQVWATGLLSAVLVDRADDRADTRGLPLERSSRALVCRSRSFVASAAARGAAHDPVADLAAQPDLGIRTATRLNRDQARLDTLPPELQS